MRLRYFCIVFSVAREPGHREHPHGWVVASPEVMTPPEQRGLLQDAGLHRWAACSSLPDGDIFHAVPPTRRGIVPAFQKCLPVEKESERRGGGRHAEHHRWPPHRVSNRSHRLTGGRGGRGGGVALDDGSVEASGRLSSRIMTHRNGGWRTAAAFGGRRLLLVLVTGEAVVGTQGENNSIRCLALFLFFFLF